MLNHYVIKPRTEEKKAKLSKHYDKMIGILKDWYGIKFELKNKNNDFPKISIPLYIDVIDQIQELDNVQHIELHFKDKRYHTINALYQKLKLAQNDHNEQVRKNLPIFEKKLLELMSGRIHLQDDHIKEAVLGKFFNITLKYLVVTTFILFLKSTKKSLDFMLEISFLLMMRRLLFFMHLILLVKI